MPKDMRTYIRQLEEQRPDVIRRLPEGAEPRKPLDDERHPELHVGAPRPVLGQARAESVEHLA